MPSTSDPNATNEDERAAELFTVAKLALWAGDAARAEQRLTEILTMHRVQSRDSISVFESPLVSSSQRARRQLRRRLSEYHRLGRSAQLDSNNTVAQNSLESQGTHISAIIWVISESEFELRGYLNDLSWETDFYKMAATRASHTALSNAGNLQYGTGRETSPSEEPQEMALEVEWAVMIRNIFLQVAVSDFCTVTARGVWTGTLSEESLEQIPDVFQELLNHIDPGT